jgi:guanine deaminase
MYDETFMQQALALSARALNQAGTEPFGAVVVRDGIVVGQGFNHSVAHFDPTSHGEIEAIRDACRHLQRVDLAGCDLYSSCEPCAMCVAAMRVAGIGRLFYAATLAESGAAFESLPVAARHPIDVQALRLAAGATLEAGPVQAEQHMAAQAINILRAWAAQRTA